MVWQLGAPLALSVRTDTVTPHERMHGTHQQYLFESKEGQGDVESKGGKLNSVMWGSVGEGMDGTFRCFPLLNLSCLKKEFFDFVKDNSDDLDHLAIFNMLQSHGKVKEYQRNAWVITVSNKVSMTSVVELVKS